MVFELEGMIAIIEGKKKAYESLIEDNRNIDTKSNKEWLKRLDAKRCLCDELLKEYEARK